MIVAIGIVRQSQSDGGSAVFAVVVDVVFSKLPATWWMSRWRRREAVMANGDNVVACVFHGGQ